MVRLFIIFCSVCLLNNCSKKEEIIAIAPPETASDTQKKDFKVKNTVIEKTSLSQDDEVTPSSSEPTEQTTEVNPVTITPSYQRPDDNLVWFNIKYDISKIHVNNPTNTGSTVRNVISDIVNSFVEIAIKVGGDFSIDADPIHLPMIKEFDLTVVKQLRIKRLYFEIQEGDENAQMGFIKELNVNFLGSDNENWKDSSTIVYKTLSFNKILDQYGCDGKCLDFKISDQNLMDIINKHSEIFIQADLSIDTAPENSMTINGLIEFDVGMEWVF